MDKNKFKINVKWEVDESPDLDWLGKYTDKTPSTAHIDRKNNLLVIPNRKETVHFSNYDDYEKFMNELEELEISYTWEEKEDDSDYHIEYNYYQKLSDHHKRYGNGQYRFLVSTNYEEADESDYDCIIEDYEELEDYNDGKWYMRGCIIDVLLNNIELGSSSLWGLDSTMSEEDDKSIVMELTDQAIQIAEENLKMLKEIE